MAKKAELLAEAKKLKLEVSSKNTIAEIEAVIKNSKGDDGTTKEDNKTTSQTIDEKPEKVAKAGKRSSRALAEKDEKLAKEAKKESDTEDETEVKTPKIFQKPVRSKLERSGKKIKTASKLVDKNKEYSIKEAVELAVQTVTTKFDSTIELHIRLNVDPKHADQNIRENIILPAGSGTTVKVAVFCEADDVTEAKKAGADIAGSDEFLQQLDKGIIDFDVLIATPTVMVKLGKYAKLLGPKGLMPNPKSGTVTTDVSKAVKESKAGKVELRVDEAGIVHLGIGKASFGADKIFTNVQAVFLAVKNAKPGSIKGNYIKSIYATSTMGPSIKIGASEL